MDFFDVFISLPGFEFRFHGVQLHANGDVSGWVGDITIVHSRIRYVLCNWDSQLKIKLFRVLIQSLICFCVFFRGIAQEKKEAKMEKDEAERYQHTKDDLVCI